MSFFGKAQTTTTRVSPDPRITQMLKGILEDANKIDDFDFIQHDVAEMTPEQRASFNTMAQSGNLRAIGGALSPRLMQGIEQATQLNKTYENAASNKISAQEVLNTSNQLRNGLYSAVQQTGQSANNVAGRLGSSSARSAQRRAATQMQAKSNLDPSLTNRAIDIATAGRQNTLDAARLQGDLAGQNMNLGMQGIEAQDQATRNQLQIGNLIQGYDNALNLNRQQNQQGQNDFIFSKLNNKASILQGVSNLAGYTIKETGAGVSRDRQLLGAGMSVLGNLGRQGYLGNEQTSNAWNSYNNNGGQSGVAGPMPGGGNLSTQPQQTQSGFGNFLNNAWTGVKGALSNY
ncbi:hypothetical protein [Enterobacter pseudoroggenkampii]|uniref:hypothetical protein n=1 Tax=Enterobacter pseudoroggenkampii TaxID=2996112 RepID=UPI0022649BC3|nr:hypothetical protein [Enterobacter pseudoroggenkampii]MCX8289114.1 hypothetical protein [Enterobacter pseudoroggenkampii]